MLRSIGPMELGLILLIVLLIFGGAKLPELAKGLGRGIREFKQSLRDDGPAEGKAATGQPAEGSPGKEG